MGVGTGSRPMRPGTSMKEIQWRFTGLMAETSYIKRYLGQALQTLNRCAWCPLGVGKQLGLSESIASPLGEYSLLGCTVAPGFEFRDFEMLSDGSAALAHITSLHATLAELA